MSDKKQTSPFHSVESEVHQRPRMDPYELAFLDDQFILNEANRPIRLMLEYVKPDTIMREQQIETTIVVFGSARLLSKIDAQKLLVQAKHAHEEKPSDVQLKKPFEQAKAAVKNSHYYEEARRFGQLVSSSHAQFGSQHHVIVTGGGPGIMEAANRGSNEAGSRSIGLSILLPHEQSGNPYITDELNFRFHYFAIRKMHFLLRARAAVFFPGGFGTLDELFETLTLLQTKKMSLIPIILFGKEYWSRLLNFEYLAEEGMISEEDLNLFTYAETAEEVWAIIANFYNL